MGCKNPSKCRKRAEKLAQQQRKVLPYAMKKFQELFRENKARLQF